MTARTRWSYSSLSTYLSRCSLQYRYRYLDRLEPERNSSRLAFGSAIHAGLEAAYRSWKRDEPVPLALAQEAFEADIAIRLQDPILEFKKGETPKTLIDQGKALLAKWAEEAKYEEVVAVEKDFSVPVVHPQTGETLDADLSGVMDLLVKVPYSDSPLVIDFKTSARKYSSSQMDFDLQAVVYAYAARQLYRVDTVPMRWDILVKTKKPSMQRIEFVKGPEGDARLFELIRAAERGVRAGVFHPNDGSMWCSGCPFSKACTTWQENPSTFRTNSPKELSRSAP